MCQNFMFYRKIPSYNSKFFILITKTDYQSAPTLAGPIWKIRILNRLDMIFDVLIRCVRGWQNTYFNKEHNQSNVTHFFPFTQHYFVTHRFILFTRILPNLSMKTDKRENKINIFYEMNTYLASSDLFIFLFYGLQWIIRNHKLKNQSDNLIILNFNINRISKWLTLWIFVYLFRWLSGGG